MTRLRWCLERTLRLRGIESGRVGIAHHKGPRMTTCLAKYLVSRVENHGPYVVNDIQSELLLKGGTSRSVSVTRVTYEIVSLVYGNMEPAAFPRAALDATVIGWVQVLIVSL